MVGSARERFAHRCPGTIIHFQAGDAGVAAVFGDTGTPQMMPSGMRLWSRRSIAVKVSP
jgi:hypothetical protein